MNKIVLGIVCIVLMVLGFIVGNAFALNVGDKIWLASDKIEGTDTKIGLATYVTGKETVDKKEYVLVGADPKNAKVGVPVEVSKLEKSLITKGTPSKEVAAKYAVGERLWIANDPSKDGSVSLRPQSYITAFGTQGTDAWVFITTDPSNAANEYPMLVKELDKRLIKKFTEEAAKTDTKAKK
jgi:hypothetical protein